MIRAVGALVIALIFAVGAGTVLALIVDVSFRRKFQSTIKGWIEKCQF